MPIDFNLSSAESAARASAAAFAQNALKAARAEYLKQEGQHKRFQAQKPVYEDSVKNGLVQSQISPPLGGQECFAVEPSAALTVLTTGLGVTPLNIVQKPETKRFLAPFLTGSGTPLASFVLSEPGGVANFLEKGAPGLQTTARLVDGGKYWELHGEKIWATNSAGWDFGGADLSRNEAVAPDSDPKDAVMILLVTRDDIDASGPGAFQVLRHVETVGLPSVSGPHVRYTNVRVPADNVLCPPGQGGQIAMATFDCSGVLVAVMAVGLMRNAFDAALAFAKSDDRRGAVPLLERQAFADLLSGIKMSTEACHALTWKAAHNLMNGPGDYDARRELANSAKVYCSETSVKAVTDAIKAPFGDLLKHAMLLPIVDWGNVGGRMRQLQQLMLSPTYDPWASTFGPTETSE
ncbi:hypothetical protein VMCG_06745 [Cytospora schulzeri]|uniref:Acyl-CoA dehydrogenase/oxidase C-terminal domain-containing protein n=1 Tax=Cytospora schulzeri TaxID=448051 RepID=A0A423W627_9PEZI|nr:hypothetical protein VMCG_06745 [Valsa malicola]